MKMTGSREGFGNDKPLWKQRRGHLLQFPDHKATEKENSGKNLRKTKEKERAENQAVTIAFFITYTCSYDYEIMQLPNTG